MKVCVLLPPCSRINILGTYSSAWWGETGAGAVVLSWVLTCLGSQYSPPRSCRAQVPHLDPHSPGIVTNSTMLFLVLTHPHLARDMWWPWHHHKYPPTCLPDLPETSLSSRSGCLGQSSFVEFSLLTIAQHLSDEGFPMRDWALRRGDQRTGTGLNCGTGHRQGMFERCGVGAELSAKPQWPRSAQLDYAFLVFIFWWSVCNVYIDAEVVTYSKSRTLSPLSKQISALLKSAP